MREERFEEALAVLENVNHPFAWRMRARIRRRLAADKGWSRSEGLIAALVVVIAVLIGGVVYVALRGMGVF